MQCSNKLTEPVTIAMRYGNPSPAAAYNELLKKDPSIEEVILFAFLSSLCNE